MSEILTALPYIAGGAGYAIGTVADYVLQRRIEAERQPGADAFPDIFPTKETAFITTRRALISLSAGSLALAAGLTTYALTPGEIVPPEQEVAVIVDGSGGTAFAETTDGTPPVETFRSILTTLETEAGSLDLSPLYASEGRVQPMTLEDILSAEPIGDAPLGEAVDIALGNIEAGKTDQILIVTDGNSFGDTNTLKSAALEAGVPVSIVSAQETTDETKAAAFRDIADATGGDFQVAEDVTAESAGRLVDTSEDRAAELAGSIIRAERLSALPWAILAGALAVGSMVVRRRQPLALTDKAVARYMKGKR